MSIHSFLTELLLLVISISNKKVCDMEKILRVLFFRPKCFLFSEDTLNNAFKDLKIINLLSLQIKRPHTVMLISVIRQNIISKI